MAHAIMCPQCNAPLSPHRFARSIVCSYCGATVKLDEAAVSAEDFRKAFRVWNAPETYQFSAWVSIDSSHWALERCIAHGDIADVYTARRARWPTELAVLKVLRNRRDLDRFENEWEALQELQRSQAPGADNFTRLIPQPIMHGELTGGAYAGQQASVFRWASGFLHTFDEVIQAFPHGIPPRASIWVWRRILEVLSFLHASGMAHGAVLPSNLLIQQNEHGVRLVGYGCAGHFGEKRCDHPQGTEAFYPAPAQSQPKLSAQLDLTMSARCVAAVLGGDPAAASVPAAVPARLAEIVQRVAQPDPAGKTSLDAWTIREELGRIADDVFGPPKFIPIVMPS
jgi:serine/threonine protein kinase